METVNETISISTNKQKTQGGTSPVVQEIRLCRDLSSIPGQGTKNSHTAIKPMCYN